MGITWKKHVSSYFIRVGRRQKVVARIYQHPMSCWDDLREALYLQLCRGHGQPNPGMLHPRANYNSKWFMSTNILVDKWDGSWSMEIWVLTSTPYMWLHSEAWAHVPCGLRNWAPYHNPKFKIIFIKFYKISKNMIHLLLLHFN